MTDEDAREGHCEGACGDSETAWLEKCPQLHVETVPRLCPPEGTCSEQGADVRCTHQAPPAPPGPKSRTRRGWLVQGAVWGPRTRPRLTLQLSDLGLLPGRQQRRAAQGECAAWGGRCCLIPKMEKNVLHLRLTM